MRTNRDKVEFFYRKFYYDRHTLTPRLETESLVRYAIVAAKASDMDVLVDVGTGSGVIGISIEKNTDIKWIYGLEKSANAIKVTKANIGLNESKMELLKSDLLDVFLDDQDSYDFRGKKMLFAANLPYIKDDDWQNMSNDTRFEPKMALFGGKSSGFELYARYYKQLLAFKKAFEPNKIFSISEIGFDQKEVARDFFKKAGLEVEFKPDLRGIERFICIEL